MSQLHEVCATWQLGAEIAVTWLNGLGSRLILMPSCEALDCSCVISDSIQEVLVAYGRVNDKASRPAWTPGPHLAGVVQVVEPLATTFQPLLVSSCLAMDGLYGNGSPALPCEDR